MGTFALISTLLTVPQSLSSSVQLYDWLFGRTRRPAHDSAGVNAEQTQEHLQNGLRELEQRCLIGEEQAKCDNIPSEHQRQTILQLFARTRRAILKEEAQHSGRHRPSNVLTASADEVLQLYSTLCDLAEDARLQALRCTYNNALPSPADGEIGKIKERLRKDQPLIGESDIYSSTDRPPGLEFAVGGDRSPLVTLGNLQCFMEYFPFGTEFAKTKSRICLMMLLLQRLRCPHVMEPVKVFSVAECSQPGFYTCSRVPVDLESGATAAGELSTLDECVSRVGNRKKVVIHLSLAVQELHAQTILHKNICANNVVVDGSDNAWLAGLSSSRLEDQSSYKIPQEEMARVKMVYYDGPASSYVRSFKCDIYALGVVMLETALGKSFVNSAELTSKFDIFSLLDHRVKAGPFKYLIYKCLAPEARSRPIASDICSALEAMSVQDIDCSQPTS